MTEEQKKRIERLAEDTGLAVVLVDERSSVVMAANDNSVCETLCASEEFGSRCGKQCGQAFQMASHTGGPVNFECHAGLECTVIPVDGERPMAAIVGRSFTKSENYHTATEKALAGEWQSLDPGQLFGNVLLSGSTSNYDKAVKQVGNIFPKKKVAPAPAPTSVIESSPAPVVKVEEQKPALVEEPKAVELEQTKTVEPVPAAPVSAPVAVSVPEPAQPSEVEAQQWRNLLASLLNKTYRQACSAIVGFLHERYSVESVAWLERREGHFDTLMSDGRFVGRQFRISMGANDERLVGAMRNGTSLELRSTTAEGGTMSVSLFPVSVGGDIKSALALSGGVETEESKSRIVAFCEAFAAEIEILRLRDEVQKKSLLSNAVERFNRSLDKIESEQFWADLLNISAELMQAERGSLMVFDENKKEFDIVAVVGANPSRLKSDKATVGKRVAEAVLRRGIPIVVSDTVKAGLSAAPDDRSYRTGSFISYPFRIGEGKLGVLNVTDKVDGTEYTAQDLEILNAVAPQFSVLIDRATLISKAGEYQQLSVTDPLTGLLNRRYLRERLAEEVQRTLRGGRQMSFMMIDVDEFKSYNDAFGHSEGDLALQTVAKCLKESLRGADVAVRFGGEEFSILLPQTSAEEAKVIGERVRARVAATRFRNRPVTVSIGIASCCTKIKTADGLIEAADKALYVAKREGRNRVKQFNEQEATVDELVLDPVVKGRK